VGLVENIGPCTLYLGDCLKILPKLGKVDAAITDPPYGTTNLKWDKNVDIVILWGNTNLIVTFAAEPYTSTIICDNKYFKERLIWEKHRAANFGNYNYRHLKYTEDIVILAKEKYAFNPQMQPRNSDRVRQAQKGNSKQWRTNRKDTQEVSFGTQYEPQDWEKYNPDLKLPGDILRFLGVVSNSGQKTKHPTQKPIKLLEYLVLTYTNKGQLIIDPFMGSGTTGVACVNCQRRFIGIEINEEYFDIACKRIKHAAAQGQFDFETDCSHTEEQSEALPWD
jgi:site-specific DNA-methyltransferase (adenine-specific)